MATKGTTLTVYDAVCGDGSTSLTLEANVEQRVPKPEGSRWAFVRVRSTKTAIISHGQNGTGVLVSATAPVWFCLDNTSGLNCTGGASSVIDVVWYSRVPGVG